MPLLHHQLSLCLCVQLPVHSVPTTLPATCVAGQDSLVHSPSMPDRENWRDMSAAGASKCSVSESWQSCLTLFVSGLLR
jgi:hypothetical protein